MQSLIIKSIIELSMLLTLGMLYYFIRKHVLYLLGATLIGLSTFALVFVLGKNEFGMATGIGLFALFGIIRYRTEQLPIVEMTYLFVSITISVVNAITDDLMITQETAFFINGLLIAISALLMFINQKQQLNSISVSLDSTDWLSLSENERIHFLKNKVNMDVISYQLIEIDYLRETSNVQLNYRS
jgi:hypothetical protein